MSTGTEISDGSLSMSVIGSKQAVQYWVGRARLTCVLHLQLWTIQTMEIRKRPLSIEMERFFPLA